MVAGSSLVTNPKINLDFGKQIMKKRKLLRKFKTEAEKSKFWETHDSTE